MIMAENVVIEVIYLSIKTFLERNAKLINGEESVLFISINCIRKLKEDDVVVVPK